MAAASLKLGMKLGGQLPHVNKRLHDHKRHFKRNFIGIATRRIGIFCAACKVEYEIAKYTEFSQSFLLKPELPVSGCPTPPNLAVEF